MIHTIDDLYAVNDKQPELLAIVLKSKKIQQLLTSMDQVSKLNIRDENTFKSLSPVLEKFSGKDIARAKSFVFSNATSHLPDISMRVKAYRPPFSRRQQTYSPMVNSLIDDEQIRKEREYTCARMLTLADYFDLTQFGDNGYYVKGRIKFGDRDEGGHYTTYASHGHALAIGLAERLFIQWRANRKKQFTILEIGAGDGDLCYKILNYLDNKSHLNKSYRDFYHAIRYHIIDRSPALNERQKKLLQPYAAKVKVHAGDAMNLSACEFKQQCDIVISNELLDMFPPQCVHLSDDGSIKVMIVVPTVKLDKLAELFNYDDAKIKAIKESAESFKTALKYFYDINISGLPLDKETFIKIFNSCTEDQLNHTNSFFEFTKKYIPVEDVPQVKEFLSLYPEALEGMKPGQEKHIQLGLHHFMLGVSKLGKIIVSIDYGEITFRMIGNKLRTYGTYGGGSSDVFASPGLRDMTTDVDFSVQALIGMRFGLEFHGYYAQQGVLADKHQRALRQSLMSEFPDDITSLTMICGNTLNASANNTGLTQSEVWRFNNVKRFMFTIFAAPGTTNNIRIEERHKSPCTPAEIMKDKYRRLIKK